MQKTLAIARREIGERSFVFITAVAVTIAPALALLVPRGTLADRLSVFAVLSLVLAVGFTGGLSGIVGVSLIGREVTEKRLSFYFSRPVTAAQIWFGKLLAAFTLIAGSAVIVFLPSLFAFPHVSKSWATFPMLLGYIALAVGLLFATGHALSTMVRSRSTLLIADFVAAVVFTIALGAMLMPLPFHHATGLAIFIVLAVLTAFVIAVALGGAWQLSRGRIDVRRNHRELSKFLWTAAAITLVLVLGFTVWVASAGPQDIRQIHLAHAPNGSWLFVSGPAKHRLDYEVSALYDVKSGASIPVPIQFQWTGGFDRTGSGAMWVEPANPIEMLLRVFAGRGHSPLEIVVAKLEPGAKPLHTGIFIDATPRYGDLTSDLSRAALIGKETLTVYDLKARKSLGSARVGTALASFASPDVVWVSGREQVSPMNWVTRISKYDIPTHTLTKVFETTARGNGVNTRVLDDNRTAIVRTWFGGAKLPDSTPAVRLFDITTGQQLPIPLGDQVSTIRALRDGRLLIARGAALQIYSGGTLQREITIPGAKSVRVDGEVGDGLFVVTHEWGARVADIVDINKGRVIASAPGLMAITNSNGTPVYQDGSCTYMTWDWQTNERKAIF